MVRTSCIPCTKRAERKRCSDIEALGGSAHDMLREAMQTCETRTEVPHRSCCRALNWGIGSGRSSRREDAGVPIQKSAAFKAHVPGSCIREFREQKCKIAAGHTAHAISRLWRCRASRRNSDTIARTSGR